MIGIFDSGVGGLSVYQEIKKIFPLEKILYLADHKNFPYGEKSETELLDICSRNIRFLQSQGAKIVVIACNSATVSTIRGLRESFRLPLVGIEPAVKKAARESQNGKIGLLATARTVTSHEGDKWLDQNQDLVKKESQELIEKVENDFCNITDEDLKLALSPIIDQNVDCIALGCTHYHFLKKDFEKLYPEIRFFAPDTEVARRVKTVVDEERITLENGSDEFFTTGNENDLVNFIEEVLKIEDPNVRKI